MRLLFWLSLLTLLYIYAGYPLLVWCLARLFGREPRRAGYDAVWASTVGTNGRETNAQALRRIVVRRPFSADRIVAMVEGWQPSFWWAANHVR